MKDTITKPKTKISGKAFHKLCNEQEKARLNMLKDSGVKITNTLKDKVKFNVEKDLAKSFTFSSGGISNINFMTIEDQKLVEKIVEFIANCRKKSKTGLSGVRPVRKDVKKPYSIDNLTGLIEVIGLGYYLNHKGKTDMVPTPIQKSNMEKVIGIKLPTIKKTKKTKKSTKK